MSATPERFERRFWGKVQKGEGCWLWTAARTTGGYGKFGDWERKKTWAAHRLSWELTNGPIEKGLEVCHRCNVKLCVRPDHMYLATHSQNSADAARDGLYWSGSKNSLAKLTESQVVEIRQAAANGEPASAIGRRFGIHRARVSEIVRGAAWKRVPGAAAPSVSSVGLFLAEQCMLDNEGRVLVRDLYASYSEWAISRGLTPLNKFPFGRQVGMRGMRHFQVRFGVRGWSGLRLKAS